MKRGRNSEAPSAPSSKVSRTTSLTSIIQSTSSQGAPKQSRKAKPTTTISASQPVGSTFQLTTDSAKTITNGSPVPTHSTASGLLTCNLCRQYIDNELLQISILHCCLCDLDFHGECCNVDEHLIEHLHIVNEVGGWCCKGCRTSKRGKITKNINQINSDNIESMKIELNKITALLFEQSSVISGQTYAEAARAPSAVSAAPTTAPVSGNIPHRSGIPKHTDVLTAVHEEFKSIAERARNIVVTGMGTSSIAPDAVQFEELCFEMLGFAPKVQSTHRFGKRIDGKIQPLLVVLGSSIEVNHVLSIAKNLRHSKSPYIRDNVFFNKHMTKAESLAAYNARVKRRYTKSVLEPNSYDVDDPLRMASTSGFLSNRKSLHPLQSMDFDITGQTSAQLLSYPSCTNGGKVPTKSLDVLSTNLIDLSPLTLDISNTCCTKLTADQNQSKDHESDQVD